MRFISAIDLRLAIRNLEWPHLVALLLCAAGLAIQFFAVPYYSGRRTECERQAIELRDGSDAIRDRILDDGYSAFRAHLVAAEMREETLKQVFSLAAKEDIVLAQADYDLAQDRSGKFSRLQISLPVKGSYSHIRRFVDSLLVDIPALALDEINFRRDTVKAANLEARLRLTLHIRAGDEP